MGRAFHELLLRKLVTHFGESDIHDIQLLPIKRVRACVTSRFRRLCKCNVGLGEGDE